MDVTGQDIVQPSSWIQRLTASMWYALRSPKVTGGLVVLLIIVVILGLVVIPQQTGLSSGSGARSAWITDLPAPVQPWGDPLYFLGFAKIFQSLWFWLPLALLFLNSLIAVADYGPGSWRRLRKRTPPIEWRHPLAYRAEYPVRLPETPDRFLATLKESLVKKGFHIYKSVEAEKRIIGAAQRRWAWLGFVALYVGLILVTIGAVISFHFSKIDSFTLVPFEPGQSSLFAGQFELAEFDSERGVGQVIYIPPGAESSPAPGQSPQRSAWRLYQPLFFNKVLVWPFGAEPVLTVEARDNSGAQLKLIPVQENLLPAEHLNLPLVDADTPLYLSIPGVGMAVQIRPDPESPGRTFEIEFRYSSKTASENDNDNIRVQTGEPFKLDDLSMTVTPNYGLKVMAYRDPAQFLYLSGAILVIAGAFAFFLKPRQLWLMPEIKGRGGQLYGVVEQFVFTKDAPQLLERLFRQENPAVGENSGDATAHIEEPPDHTIQKLEVN